jgi:hypothetical protein
MKTCDCALTIIRTARGRQFTILNAAKEAGGGDSGGRDRGANPEIALRNVCGVCVVGVYIVVRGVDA